MRIVGKVLTAVPVGNPAPAGHQHLLASQVPPLLLAVDRQAHGLHRICWQQQLGVVVIAHYKQQASARRGQHPRRDAGCVSRHGRHNLSADPRFLHGYKKICVAPAAPTSRHLPASASTSARHIASLARASSRGSTARAVPAGHARKRRKRDSQRGTREDAPCGRAGRAGRAASRKRCGPPPGPGITPSYPGLDIPENWTGDARRRRAMSFWKRFSP